MMKKAILSTGLLIFSLGSFAQNFHTVKSATSKQKKLPVISNKDVSGSHFTITGKTRKAGKSAKMYLYYSVNGQIHTESARLVNGSFSFQGKVEDIAIGMMTLSHNGTGTGDKDRLSFDFGPENISITIVDSLNKAVVNGSKVYAERKEYETFIAPTSSSIYLSARKKEGELSADDKGNPAGLADIAAWEQEQKDACKKRLTDYINGHPWSRYSVDALRELFYVFGMDITALESRYNQLNATAQSSYQGKKFARWLITKKIIQPGRTAPDFTGKTPDNKDVSLTNFKNHWLLLEFWASWCLPCRSESPNLGKQYELYKSKGFQILSFSADNDKNSWLNAIAKDKLTWTQISDLNGMSGSMVIDLYGVDALPFNVLIDPDGKIVATNLRGVELNKRLQQVFKDVSK